MLTGRCNSILERRRFQILIFTLELQLGEESGNGSVATRSLYVIPAFLSRAPLHLDWCNAKTQVTEMRFLQSQYALTVSPRAEHVG